MYSNLSTINDQLVKEVTAGDKNAQRQFVHLAGKYVYGALHSYNNLSKVEISDLYQTVFLKLFEDNMRRIRMWKGESKFTTYLYRLTINLVKDYFGSAQYRHANSMVHQDDESSHSHWEIKSPEPEPDEIIQSMSLMACLSGLRDIERSVIHYYYFLGYKEREIAEMLNFPVNTISSMKNRAIRKIRAGWNAEV